MRIPCINMFHWIFSGICRIVLNE
uniref:Uncharacterized protein n=1 Tax=Anguilla anguilla TaxID=7936 RepID=A0A0E9TQZ1_ANGAN